MLHSHLWPLLTSERPDYIGDDYAAEFLLIARSFHIAISMMT